MKIAICFFGITRSVRHTLPSIEQNIYTPCRDKGEVRVFAHFFDQTRVISKRSRENVKLDPNEHRLLKIDDLQLEAPEGCLEEHGFEQLKAFGDTRRDGFQSLRNLTCALHSLSRVATHALAWQPDIFVFVRPDLRYHESLRDILNQAISGDLKGAVIPDWQHWRGGLNDRFAICTTQAAAEAYAMRVHKMRSYCEYFQEPLHAESLLRYVMENERINIYPTSVKASRIRADGRLKNEHFGPSKADRFKTAIRQTRRKFRGRDGWLSLNYGPRLASDGDPQSEPREFSA